MTLKLDLVSVGHRLKQCEGGCGQKVTKNGILESQLTVQYHDSTEALWEEKVSELRVYIYADHVGWTIRNITDAVVD